jgi:hypothetical protein
MIKCEKKTDFDQFREELLAGLKPDGAVEAMLAERVVSLSWRLKRAERMSNEVIDVKIAKIENDSWEKEKREKAGLLDFETGRSELVFGWTIMRDFSDAQILERLLMYEKQIESSLYKAMNELQKLQGNRRKEEAEEAIPKASGFEAATQSEEQLGQNEKQIHLAEPVGEMKKQSQCRPPAGSTKLEILNPKPPRASGSTRAKQTQSPVCSRKLEPQNSKP